jgi:hypothetical protein
MIKTLFLPISSQAPAVWGGQTDFSFTHRLNKIWRAENRRPHYKAVWTKSVLH